MRPLAWALVFAEIGVIGALCGGLAGRAGLTVDDVWLGFALAAGLCAAGTVFYWALWPSSPLGQAMRFGTPLMVGMYVGTWAADGLAGWAEGAVYAGIGLAVAAVAADWLGNPDDG